MNDEGYMRLAMTLAERGAGHVNPNPMVGAVIVKDDRVIGQGWHARYGDLHAERAALAACTEDPRGAVIYVTLEPCCHHGKQPPCTDALIEAGIARVVTGAGDPNPLVNGKGIRILREHGIEVTEGVLAAECRRQNEVFFHYIQTRRPFVVMKYAMTLDGKICTFSGDSRWVTGPEARTHVHQTRKRLAAIMAGVGTVIADDPMLNCRVTDPADPIRVICDSGLRTPQDCAIVRTAGKIPTIIATCCADEARSRPYTDAGCQIIVTNAKDGHVDLAQLMELLGARGIDSILLEGGGTLNFSALKAGIVQKVQAYIAPKLIGGTGAKTPIEGAGLELMASAVPLTHLTVTALGDDILIEGYIEREAGSNCSQA